MRASFLLASCSVLFCACGWPQTRMEPVAEYQAGRHATISAAPSYTAGTNYVRTTSRDGATLFVCVDGSTRKGSAVPPRSEPAC